MSGAPKPILSPPFLSWTFWVTYFSADKSLFCMSFFFFFFFFFKILNFLFFLAILLYTSRDKNSDRQNFNLLMDDYWDF